MALSLAGAGVAQRAASAPCFDLNAVSGVIVRAKGLAARMKNTPPANVYKREGEIEARKAFESYESPAFQRKVLLENERLKKEVFGGFRAHYKGLGPGPGKKDVSGGRERLSLNERIYLFISSSVPEATLRTYIEQIAELKDPSVVVLMRGFIGGMKYMGPTLKFMGKLLEKDPSCGLSCGLYGVDVEVDPLLFGRYGILQVPAVVYVPDIEVLGPGSEGLKRNAKVGRSYAFYGDAALAYSLKRINEEAKSASLAAVIREFTHGFYR
ncbi:MAG: type-F conjugative transfer system pilin assembly protein TrbC [Nitrospiraceae bacterium]|nr:type-F conjugative transfer system pilin assembly protein TrbC [Nitrospiraceae bacterium]